MEIIKDPTRPSLIFFNDNKILEKFYDELIQEKREN